LKYWKNGKTLKQSRKPNRSLKERMKAQKPLKKWYDEECIFAIEEIKKAREKWLIKGRREKEDQEYHHKRKEAHKIIRNKKKTYMKNVIKSTEDQKHNNTRKYIK
jgi:hypothetical protein